MEFRGNRRRMVQQRKTRGFALLGTMLLLFGLILKVQAHAPGTAENPSIHTLRPALVVEVVTFDNLHPPAKPVFPGHPNQLLNPTTETDLDGGSCRECHPGSRFPAAQTAEHIVQDLSFQAHSGLKSGYACETCHFAQLSLVNEGIFSR